MVERHSLIVFRIDQQGKDACLLTDVAGSTECVKKENPPEPLSSESLVDREPSQQQRRNRWIARKPSAQIGGDVVQVDLGRAQRIEAGDEMRFQFLKDPDLGDVSATVLSGLLPEVAVKRFNS